MEHVPSLSPSCHLDQVVPSPTRRNTLYGPCHCASSFEVDVGSSTCTWSPGSKVRSRAVRSYHFFCCLWAFPMFSRTSSVVCCRRSRICRMSDTTLSGLLGDASHSSFSTSSGPALPAHTIVRRVRIQLTPEGLPNMRRVHTGGACPSPCHLRKPSSSASPSGCR